MTTKLLMNSSFICRVEFLTRKKKGIKEKEEKVLRHSLSISRIVLDDKHERILTLHLTFNKKIMKTIILALVILATVYCTQASKKNYRPCEEARQLQTNPVQHCGNNGNIYPNKHAFECAKLTNSRLRKISCNDSLILAKNALGNIRQQNQNGELLTQREKIQRMRQRHEEQQRQRELEQQQRQQRQG